MRSERWRETRSDQAAVISVVIIGRIAKLIRQGARKGEGGSESRKNEQLQRHLLVLDVPKMGRFQARVRASSLRGLRRHKSA